jgi:hypothetical protein
MHFTFLKTDKISEVRTIYNKYHLQLQKDDWWKRIIVYEAGKMHFFFCIYLEGKNLFGQYNCKLKYYVFGL